MAAVQKYRLYFPDGDWFQDEDGRTEFSSRQADANSGGYGESCQVCTEVLACKKILQRPGAWTWRA